MLIILFTINVFFLLLYFLVFVWFSPTTSIAWANVLNDCIVYFGFFHLFIQIKKEKKRTTAFDHNDFSLLESEWIYICMPHLPCGCFFLLYYFTSLLPSSTGELCGALVLVLKIVRLHPHWVWLWLLFLCYFHRFYARFHGTHTIDHFILFTCSLYTCFFWSLWTDCAIQRIHKNIRMHFCFSLSLSK